MTTGRRRSHRDEMVSILREQAERDSFAKATKVLQQHLVHTRDLPNGKDFLFRGSAEEIHAALRDLRDIEQKYSRFLLFDYAQVDEYYLLRIIGSSEHRPVIDSYFDSPSQT